MRGRVPKLLVTVHKRCSPVSLLGYSWVDGEVESYYSLYNDKVNLLHFINHVSVCSLMDKDNSSIHLCCFQMDAYKRLDWVFLGKELVADMPPTRDFFYIYDGIFCDLNMELPFDDFTMSVL